MSIGRSSGSGCQQIIDLESQQIGCSEEALMSRQKFPTGWDADRVKRLIDHFESLSEDEWIAADEAAVSLPGQATVTVPTELMPAIRQLLAAHEASVRRAFDRLGDGDAVG